MAITHIQSRASTVSTIDQSLAYSSNVTANSLLLCVVREGGAQTNDPVVSDTLGNTWTKVREQTAYGGGSLISLFYAVTSTGGANTVSVDSDNVVNTRITIHEFGGSWASPALDLQSGNNSLGSASSPYATPSVNPSGAALVFATITTSSSVTFSSAGTGFTLGPVAPAASGSVTSGYNIVTGAGSVNAEFAWTGTSNGAGSIIASFVENPGPTITVQPTAQTARINGETTNTATFSVTASGTGSLTYDWELETSVGGGSYSNLADGNGATWTGQAAASCVGTFTAKTLSGRRVRCNVTDSNGTTTSTAVTLTVLDGPVLSASTVATNGSGVAAPTMTSDDALSANGEILLITMDVEGQVLARTTVRPN